MKHKFEKIRKDFLHELDYIGSIGSKLFIYPFDSSSKSKKIGFYTLYFLVVFTSLQLIFTLCLADFTNWLEIINIAPNIGVCLMATIKYKSIYTNRKFYNEIFKHFQHDVWDIVTDENNSGENCKIFMTYRTVSKMINRFMVYYSFPLIIVADSFPWIIMNYEHSILGKEKQLLYPFDAWYPFNKVKWYYAAYAWESVMTAIVISIYAFSNMINISYIAYICMELRLLGNCLQGLITEKDVRNIRKKRNVKSTHDKIKAKLKLIVKRHDYLVMISTGLNRILGDVMLLSYSFGTVFICLTAFSFTVVDDLFKSLRYFSFFISLLFEMFDQCIIGQVLSDHSEKLAENIYTSDWTHADIQTKKILLLFMLRTQKPFELTAKDYVTMNLNTFSNICSSSYQLFNLLRTLYEK